VGTEKKSKLLHLLLTRLFQPVVRRDILPVSTGNAEDHIRIMIVLLSISCSELEVWKEIPGGGRGMKEEEEEEEEKKKTGASVV
jgi:hypothetical protein